MAKLCFALCISLFKKWWRQWITSREEWSTALIENSLRLEHCAFLYSLRAVESSQVLCSEVFPQRRAKFNFSSFVFFSYIHFELYQHAFLAIRNERCPREHSIKKIKRRKFFTTDKNRKLSQHYNPKGERIGQ